MGASVPEITVLFCYWRGNGVLVKCKLDKTGEALHAGYRASDAEDLWRVGVVTGMQIRLERSTKDERSSYEGEPAAGGWSGSGWFAAEQHVEARIGTKATVLLLCERASFAFYVCLNFIFTLYFFAIALGY